MSKIAVVYWSGSGNTGKMAEAVAAGAKEKGAEVHVYSSPDDFTADMVEKYDAIAFGCPAMGVESLEEDEFEPMFNACKPKLGDKTIALFGSYGWGDGEWMENWKDDCRSIGANLACQRAICLEEPEGDTLEACKALGAVLV